MKRTSKIAIVVAGSAVAALAGTAIAIAGGVSTEDFNETPITGSALDKASAAALAHTGGGRVTGTEVGDEESLYEVEVTLDNGLQVDVQLDEAFDVVGTEDDDDKGADDER